MTWRKEPPTVDEVKAIQAQSPHGEARYWWRDNCPWRLIAVWVTQGQISSTLGSPIFLAGGEWAPCLPPDSAPPAFPPEVMEAAREALRLDEKATRDWATEDADNAHLITRGKNRSGAFRYVADFSFSDKDDADRKFALGARELLPMLARSILATAKP